MNSRMDQRMNGFLRKPTGFLTLLLRGIRGARFLVFLMLGVVAVAPVSVVTSSPAQSFDTVYKWINAIVDVIAGVVDGILEFMSSKAWDAIKSAFKKVWDFFTEETGILGDEKTRQAAINTVSGHLKATLDKRILEATNAAQGAVSAGVTMGRAVADGPDAGGDSFACNQQMAEFGVLTMERFAEYVSVTLLGDIDNHYMGVASFAGDSADAAFQVLTGRCERTGTAPLSNIKTGNPIEGLKSSCTAEDSAPGSVADIDINYKALDRSKIYIMPEYKLTTGTLQNGASVQIKQYMPNNEAEWRWVKAAQYCDNLGTGVSKPPIGKEIRAGDNTSARAVYDEYATRRNYAIKPCTDRLGSLTRPNCKNEGLDNTCLISEMACAATQEIKADLIGSSRGCRYGLSLYELEKRNVEACATDRGFLADAAGNTPQATTLSQIPGCMEIANKWSKQLSSEDETFTKSLITLRDAKRGMTDVMRAR